VNLRSRLAVQGAEKLISQPLSSSLSYRAGWLNYEQLKGRRCRQDGRLLKLMDRQENVELTNHTITQ
ncbi:hypothetical protein, partial [Limosilactobacillus pontis]|uniref:hypothetical protein n=1 Tax=Limosilactobacillus pontis TaxID=35787 RepID=UPI001F48BC41